VLRLVVADGAPIARVLQLTAVTGAAPTYPTLAAALGQQAGA
jgi:hypothetical protein